MKTLPIISALICLFAASVSAQTPKIFDLIRTGDFADAKAEIENDPDLLRATEAEGDTVLHVLAAHGWPFPGAYAFAYWLLDQDADVEATNDAGLMPYQVTSDDKMARILRPNNKTLPISNEIDLTPRGMNDGWFPPPPPPRPPFGPGSGGIWSIFDNWMCWFLSKVQPSPKPGSAESESPISTLPQEVLNLIMAQVVPASSTGSTSSHNSEVATLRRVNQAFRDSVDSQALFELVVADLDESVISGIINGSIKLKHFRHLVLDFSESQKTPQGADTNPSELLFKKALTTLLAQIHTLHGLRKVTVKFDTGLWLQRNDWRTPDEAVKMLSRFLTRLPNLQELTIENAEFSEFFTTHPNVFAGVTAVTTSEEGGALFQTLRECLAKSS